MSRERTGGLRWDFRIRISRLGRDTFGGCAARRASGTGRRAVGRLKTFRTPAIAVITPILQPQRWWPGAAIALSSVRVNLDPADLGAHTHSVFPPIPLNLPVSFRNTHQTHSKINSRHAPVVGTLSCPCDREPTRGRKC